jgi:hypothetical protein
MVRPETPRRENSYVCDMHRYSSSQAEVGGRPDISAPSRGSSVGSVLRGTESGARFSSFPLSWALAGAERRQAGHALRSSELYFRRSHNRLLAIWGVSDEFMSSEAAVGGEPIPYEIAGSTGSLPTLADEASGATGSELKAWTMLLRTAYNTNSLTECRPSLLMILLR